MKGKIDAYVWTKDVKLQAVGLVLNFGLNLASYDPQLKKFYNRPDANLQTLLIIIYQSIYTFLQNCYIYSPKYYQL